ncbi:MAG: DUF6580 family putative transport protein [Candidatus Sulfotelmatobacter sp.]
MLAYLYVILAVAVRFLPHPFAFTPVGASLLFFGARGPQRRMWLPLALLAASDIILTTMVYRYAFTWDHFVTWAWYAGMLWLGSTLRQNAGALRIMGSALAGSIVFFLVSNFAVWAAWKDLYPMTLAGLIACYGAGLPFFRRAVEGDLLFAAAMFSAPVILQSLCGYLHKSAGDHIAAA